MFIGVFEKSGVGGFHVNFTLRVDGVGSAGLVCLDFIRLSGSFGGEMDATVAVASCDQRVSLWRVTFGGGEIRGERNSQEVMVQTLDREGRRSDNAALLREHIVAVSELNGGALRPMQRDLDCQELAIVGDGVEVVRI